MGARYRFADFTLDPDERRLCQGDRVVELSGRYLDALALLVRAGGALVPKDRFMEEVWRGVPVTDEALTQAIRTLRRALGDDAAAPRFIETVPKHGYRFIAAVEPVAGAPDAAAPDAAAPRRGWRPALLLGGAGTIGAGAAGLIGGVIYGFAGASQPLAPGLGAASVLLVLVCLTEIVALVGGAGVAFGIALASRGEAWGWAPLGGAAGGLAVGGLVKLLGLDAFNLLLGRAPGGITGGGEGALLGGAVGLAAWLATRFAASLRRQVTLAALIGGTAGALIPWLGGRLMAGSLDLLARYFPSRLRIDHLGVLVGERGFGPVLASLTGALEGALFAGCLVGAMLLARRQLDQEPARAAHHAA